MVEEGFHSADSGFESPTSDLFFSSIFLITHSHMSILYNLMKHWTSIYPGSC